MKSIKRDYVVADEVFESGVPDYAGISLYGPFPSKVNCIKMKL
jgi:hypothetical protein